MILKLSEIFDFLYETNQKFIYYGNNELSINGFCSLKNMREKSITWIKKFDNYDISIIDKLLDLLIVTDNKCFEEAKINGYNVISCENPKEVFFSILTHFFQTSKKAKIEKNSTVLTDRIGNNVSIGYNCYICKDVTIADNVLIKNNVVIECETKIGLNSTINSGVVIGTDGFGYYKNKDGSIFNVPHFGGVAIGKFVDIGANTCIDRGTIDDTIIEDNVKIDNLCHIAHNVHIKENSYVIALSMLGGSCLLEKNSYIAPGSLLMNQIAIGENSMVGMGAVVTKDVEANKVVVGVPAKVIRDI